MASGNTLYTVTAQGNNPPAATYATPDVRNALSVLDYDAATAEYATFVGVLPRNYTGSGLTIYLHWMATSATSGAVKWNAYIERHQAGTDDQDADSFAAAQTTTTTATSPSGTEMVTAITFTSGAQMDSLAAGERFRLKIERDAANGADTMTGDAELVAVEIKET